MHKSNAWNNGFGSGNLVIHRMKNGFKVKIWGQPSNHLMDWNGCNYRVATVDSQPHRGFRTLQEAVKFARARFKSQKEVDTYAKYEIGNGTFLGDSVVKEFIDVKFKK